MSLHTERTAQIEASTKQSQEEGFSRWMERPETKILISLIPPTGDNPELLESLLKSAFFAGHSKGEGNMLGEMMTMLMKPKPGDLK